MASYQWALSGITIVVTRIRGCITILVTTHKPPRRVHESLRTCRTAWVSESKSHQSASRSCKIFERFLYRCLQGAYKNSRRTLWGFRGFREKVVGRTVQFRASGSDEETAGSGLFSSGSIL